MADIIQNLDQTPEFAALIPSQLITKFKTVQSLHPSNSSDPSDVKAKKAVLRELFGSLMTSPTESVQIQVDKLVDRYSKMSESEVANSPEGYFIPLVLELNRQFPGDIGIFCVYVLNIINLRPGESIFLGAGEPHAYISGDIIECMATSDNVLRAGLTPKARDVANLLESLTYNMGTPTKQMIVGTPWGSEDNGTTKTILYDPPIPEFSVLNVRLRSGETEHHRGINGPSIVIVIGGKGEMIGGMDKGSLLLEEGNVLFIGAGAEIIWKARHGEFELFRAFCE
jgi:mannose-6-phosphate isomerase